ncbi:Glyoxalase/bleomycin resistance protein/dioxygenase [Kribbella flavida DSM 17836]|uniref:Glyoxalase/bleomycin resistance protein/dioxygenase n=1 Tax=Kribbella flavida (strain DSM 17836 / JCM 10339 / NBRC 14399) TaxID=479435 RepID=D2PR16_KRIFD|nr:VOC family protein [Kribbella flavida]ADB32964.1 Glyoxalase/bleomycin resistance protein/dioxygenase [Kribbella flavida DSM 17836]
MSITAVPTALTTGHIGLNVTDVDRSLAFYRRVFGFDVLAEGTEADRRWAFLARDGKLLVALWQQAGAAYDAKHAGLHHLSFQVEDIEQVREVEAALGELGADFLYDGVVPHGEGLPSGGIFFTDPDGIRLEVYAPTGADTAPAPSGTAPTCGFF